MPRSWPADAQVQIPDNYRDGRWDTASIGKLQYQKNFGSTRVCAALRLYVLLEHEPSHRKRLGKQRLARVTNYQYEVDSHTGGLELQFADQLSSEHLLEGMLSYITSNTLRYYNHNYDNTASQQVSNFTNGSSCYATYTSPAITSAIRRRATST